MDATQFKRLQSAVDWAVWDTAASIRQEDRPGLRWAQGAWGTLLTADLVKSENTDFLVARCTSTGCIAGSVVMNEGASMCVPRYAYDYVKRSGDQVMYVDRAITLDGKVVNIAIHAQELLGIRPTEAEHLFRSDNNISEVVGYAETLATRYGHTLDTDGKDYEFLRGRGHISTRELS